ncbi:MAG: hypothetical protein ABR866_18925, partial [Candidatus Korobacteraceae bacterium]
DQLAGGTRMQPQQSRKHGHLYATSMSHPLSYVPLFMRMCIEAKAEGFRVENLAQNEEFVSAAIQITRSVISTHKQEKREALRNALLNIALGRAPNEDMQQMFLSYLDSLTGWHIRILAFFRNPQEALENAAKPTKAYQGPPNFYMGSPAQVMERMYPELKGQQAFYDQVVRDLFTRGLFSSDSLHGMMTVQGAIAKRTSDKGDEFLAFIANPV